MKRSINKIQKVTEMLLSKSKNRRRKRLTKVHKASFNKISERFNMYSDISKKLKDYSDRVLSKNGRLMKVCQTIPTMLSRSITERTRFIVHRGQRKRFLNNSLMNMTKHNSQTSQHKYRKIRFHENIDWRSIQNISCDTMQKPRLTVPKMALKEVKAINSHLQDDYIDCLNFLVQYKFKRINLYQDISNMTQIIHYISEVKKEMKVQNPNKYKVSFLIDLLQLEIGKFITNSKFSNFESRNQRMHMNRSI